MYWVSKCSVTVQYSERKIFLNSEFAEREKKGSARLNTFAQGFQSINQDTSRLFLYEEKSS